jgi:hypothetical protein
MRSVHFVYTQLQPRVTTYLTIAARSLSSVVELDVLSSIYSLLDALWMQTVGCSISSFHQTSLVLSNLIWISILSYLIKCLVATNADQPPV